MLIYKKHYLNINSIFFIFTLLYVFSCLNLLFFPKFKYLIYFLKLLPIVLVFIYPIKRINRTKILSLFFLYATFLLVRGFLSNNWINYIFTDFLTVLSFFYCYTFFDSDTIEEDFIKFINLASSWLIIGLPLAWFFIFTFGLLPSTEIGYRAVFANNIELSGPDNFIRTPIEFSFILLIFLPYIKNGLKYFVVLSLITYFILGIFTASRTPVLLSLISIIATFVLNIDFLKSKIFFKISVISIISFIIIFKFFSFEKVEMAFSNSYNRLAENELISSRDEEKDLYLNSITPEELWMGKGLGGSNKTGMWEKTPEGIAMIHRGDINLVMKGGIIFLTIFALIIFSTYFKLYRNKILGKYIIFIVTCYLLFESGHTLWGNFTMQLFLFLAISFAGAYDWRYEESY